MKEEIQFYKLNYDETKSHKHFSNFHNFAFKKEPTLSEVIKLSGWGSNKNIKQSGFKVAPVNPPILLKNKPIIKDPYFIVKDKTSITLNGLSLILVHVPFESAEKTFNIKIDI